MANILLSFLGGGNYTPCNYELEGRKAENISFIQEALIELLCAEWGNEDRFICCNTEFAYARSWQNSQDKDGNTIFGLQETLGKRDLPFQVQDLRIKEGFSEAEIWQVFDTIFQEVPQGATLYLDITHAFRYLPMLGITLVNYARLLKNIEVKGIYYGAFDKLRQVNPKVELIPIEERTAPILNLIDFVTLQDWTAGASDFVNFGNSKRINDILLPLSSEIRRTSKGKDPLGSAYQQLAKTLNSITMQLATVRGVAVVEAESIAYMKQAVSNIKALSPLPTLLPIISIIEERIQSFEQKDILNCFRAVSWCLDSNMIQQALTLMQEGIVGLLAAKYGYSYKDEKDRKFLSGVLAIHARKIARDKWAVEVKEREAQADMLLQTDFLCALSPIANLLNERRNDINHAGFRHNITHEDVFKDFAQKCYQDIMIVINTYYINPDVEASPSETHA